MAPTHHTIDYVELGTTDLVASKTFFTEVFGWRLTDYGPEYAGIQAPEGEGEVGGLSASTAPTEGGPLVLLYSEDLGATLEAVVNGGGTVTVAPYAFPGGRRFHFTEPGGSTLGVWGPA